jgi:hypothetical protein
VSESVTPHAPTAWSGGVAFAEADTTAFPTIRLPATPPPAEASPPPGTTASPPSGLAALASAAESLESGTTVSTSGALAALAFAGESPRTVSTSGALAALSAAAAPTASGRRAKPSVPAGERREWRQGAVAGMLALVVACAGIAASLYAQRSGEARRSGVAVVQAMPPAATSPVLPRFRAPAVHAARSPVLGRLASRTAGLSVAELGGRWARGTDTWHPLGPPAATALRADAAEYVLAPLPKALGTSAAGPAAQAVAAKVAGRRALQRYAAQPLPGGVRGSFAVCRIGPPSGHWQYVIAAVVATGRTRPGVLLITIPKSAKPAFADLPRLLASLRPTG